MITSEADVAARLPACPVLAEDDGAPANRLPAEHLDAEPLGVAVPAVAARALALLVCHLAPLLGGPNRVDTHGRHVLAVSACPPVVLALLALEDAQLRRPPLLDNCAHDRRAFHPRAADFDVIAGRNQEHVVERHAGADRRLESLEAHDVALLDSILLATRPDDRVQAITPFRPKSTKPRL